jgi:hypothetical protein
MTKADLVEKVTASIARTAGPMISKKDCARVVDLPRGDQGFSRRTGEHRNPGIRHVQDSATEDANGAQSPNR